MRAFLMFGLVLATIAADAAADDVNERQTEVRQRGADVMSFSIADTLHTFEKTPEGGVQRVEARAGHIEEVPKIRAHLKRIAQSFQSRDFSGPAHIHGESMPGLAELRGAASSELAIAYRDIDQGGEIRYTATSPGIVAAVHRWFDAQLSDHGSDATGHSHKHGD